MALFQKVIGSSKLRQAVNKMMDDAKRAQSERRSHGRIPYFQPVMLQLRDTPDLYSAFVRDISSEGIGLLHWMPIQPQEITVISHLNDGTTTRIQVKLAWCVSCGEGWYISGGRFVSVS